MLIKLVLCVLAVWRLSSMFSREDGPFRVFAHIRTWLFVHSTGFDQTFFNKLCGTLTDGILCMWCNSVWFGAILSVIVSDGLQTWAITTLAVSSAVIFLEEAWQLLSQKRS